jgi:hypothetical protein
MKLYFETEGTNKDGQTYHSDQCGYINREFFIALLDEFLEAFERNPSTAKLRFEACCIPEHNSKDCPLHA